MTEAENSVAKGFCNVLALQKGLDPAGSAGDFADVVVVEIPLPWQYAHSWSPLIRSIRAGATVASCTIPIPWERLRATKKSNIWCRKANMAR